MLAAAVCVDVDRWPPFSRNNLKLPPLPIRLTALLSLSSWLGLHLRLLLVLTNTMADPLSITASAVGIIVPALHGTRHLLEALQQLRDAPCGKWGTVSACYLRSSI